MLRRHLFALALVGLGAATTATAQATFVQDAKVAEAAEAYARTAVEDARDKHGVTLDGSEGSVADVERILAGFHDAYAHAQPKPPDETMVLLGQMYGSYVGEVYRQHHGAQWGMVSVGNMTFPGMQASDGGNPFWPWVSMHVRIVGDKDGSAVDYYAKLVARHAAPASAPAAN